MAKIESEKCPIGINSLDYLNRDYSKGIKPSLVPTHLDFSQIATEEDIDKLIKESQKPLP